MKDNLTIADSTVLPYQLDFRIGFTHGLASRSSSVNVSVMLESTDGLQGYGDCVPRDYVTGETHDSVLDTIGRILPHVLDTPYNGPGDVIDTLEAVSRLPESGGNPAALCAVELALIDLAGRYFGMTAGELLGMRPGDVPLDYSLVIPLLGDRGLDAFFAYSSGHRFKHMKVKVDADDPAGYIRRVRRYIDDGVEIRADANCSWTRDNAPRFMAALAGLGVVSVEQPLPAGDFEGMAALRGPGLPLVTLDESVRTVGDVEQAARADACDVVNVRVSKCGGMLGAKRVIDAALARGLQLQLGAHVGESCILSVAGAHLAAGLRCFRWHEGAFGSHLLNRDICEETFQFGTDGALMPPNGPGLGIDVSGDRIAEFHERFTSCDLGSPVG